MAFPVSVFPPISSYCPDLQSWKKYWEHRKGQHGSSDLNFIEEGLQNSIFQTQLEFFLP